MANDDNNITIRGNTVHILDMDAVSGDQLVQWLAQGLVVQVMGGKTLCPPDEDGYVFGSDSYGVDFFAGMVDQPEALRQSFYCTTAAERYQEGLS